MSNDRPATTRLEDFARALASRNPFLDNRVDRPYDDRLIDVDAIHAAAFQRVVDLAAQAREENRGIGAVVWGEAGVGKSHLLARLARKAPRACYVYIHNLQASPERLPRTVLRYVVSVLSRGPTPGRTLLSALVNAALKAQGFQRGSWIEINAFYNAMVDSFAEADPTRGVLFDRTIYHVLYRLFWAGHSSQRGTQDEIVSIALRWLSGDALEPAEAVMLQLPTERRPSDTVALADNQQIKQVLVALAQLARAAGRTLLLCFDQVDNLDEDQVKALTRFLHDLLDSAGNLLVVTTGVRQTLLAYRQRGVITETSWDRVGQLELPLKRLQPEQGRELLQKRLAAFLGPYLGVAAIEEKVSADPLFPLGSAWYESRLRELPDFRPRDLLGWASDRWQVLQDSLAGAAPADWLLRWPLDGPRPDPVRPVADLESAIDALVQEKLTEKSAQLRGEPSLLPASADDWLDLLAELLGQCAADRAYLLESFQAHDPALRAPRHPYDVTLEQRLPPDGQALRLGVRVLIDAHPKSAFTWLGWLEADPTPPQRVCIVTDARNPQNFGAGGRERLEGLRQREHPRYKYFQVPLEELVAMQALRAVVAMARGGDLELDRADGRRTLSAADVLASYRRTGRHLALPLLAELIGARREPKPQAAPAPAVPAAPANERKAREFIAAQMAVNHGRIALADLTGPYASMLEREGQTVELAGLEPRLQEIAERMAADGKVRLVPGPHGLTLQEIINVR